MAALGSLAVFTNLFFGPGSKRGSTVEFYQALRTEIRSGNLETAETMGRKLTGDHPGDPFLCSAFLEVLAKLGKHDEAEVVARRTLAYEDGLQGIRMQLAQTLARLGRHREATREVDLVLTFIPNNPVAQLLRGELLGDAGQVPEAVAHLEQLLVKDPKSLQARLLLAAVHRRAGAPEAALSSTRAAWKLARGHPRVLREYEAIFQSMGDEARADRVEALRKSAMNERRAIPWNWDPEALPDASP